MLQREIFKGTEHQTGSAPLDTESFFSIHLKKCSVNSECLWKHHPFHIHHYFRSSRISFFPFVFSNTFQYAFVFFSALLIDMLFSVNTISDSG